MVTGRAHREERTLAAPPRSSASTAARPAPVAASAAGHERGDAGVSASKWPPAVQICSSRSRCAAGWTRSSSARVGLAPCEGDQIGAEAGAFEPLGDGLEARGALRVARAGVVIREDGIGPEQQHLCTVPRAMRRTRRNTGAYAAPTMPEDTLRWPGGWARIGPWRGRDDVAYLAVGARRPPPAEVVDHCLGVLRTRGYGSVVTNALGPVETLPFVDAGFSVQERLHLLEHDLEELPEAAHGTRRAHPADVIAVLEVDHRAFQPFWRLDRPGLDQTLDATPATRFRVVERDTAVVGYAITGRADRQGFLQRVGVDPSADGEGMGRSLVADGLRWLRRHRVRRASVNTQLGNDAALALYRDCGFRDLTAGLCVMRRAL